MGWTGMLKREPGFSGIIMVAVNVVILVAVLGTSAFAAAPTDITLSPSKVMDTTDTSGGYVIGSLSTTDADNPGDTFTYTIVGSGADDGVFSIPAGTSDLVLTDGTISLAAPNDANADGVYEVTVRTTDGTANTFDETLQVDIVRVYNPLIHSSLSTDSTRWGGWGLTGKKYGEFTCNTCHERNTGNIKRIKASLEAPDTGDSFPIQTDGGTVSFLDAREGSSDFGDDSRVSNSTSSNICEACHTYDAAQTDGVVYHGYDMSSAGNPDHYNQADCMVCHKHNDGFKPRACDSCHGYPPTANTLGGPTGLANDPYATASATAGAHQKHALDLGYACSNCHDGYVMPQESTAKPGFGDVSISFNNFGETTGSYSGQTDVSYNDALGAGGENCTNIYCHSTGQSADGTSVTPSSYSVASWSTPASGACGTCHSDTDPATGSHTSHVNDGAACNDCHSGNNHVDHNIDVTSGAYTAGGAPGNGYGTCTTASCHDQGRGGLATTPSWGNNVTDCSECHASAPSTGGHTVHLAASIAGTAIACSDCHDAATDPATETEPSVGHRDTDIDVTTGGYPADKAKNTAFTNCSTASCHQTGQSTNDYTATSNWGTDDANCTQCHAAVPATGSHDSHVNTAGYNCSSCHTNANNGVSYNDANHGDVTIDVAVGSYITNRGDANYGTAFTTCTNISCHGDGLNAGGGDTPTWGAVAGCTACHDTVTDGTGSHAKHLVDTGNSCTDCHDVADLAGTYPGEHGDDNIDVFNANPGDLGYAQDAAIGSGSWTTCNAASCHDDGTGTLATTPAWGTATTDCTECHAGAAISSGSHGAHIADGANCSDCHDAATDPSTETAPAAGHRDTDIDTQVALGYTQDKTKGSAYETCATASCHNDGRNSGLTSTWGTTIDNCAECHATVPTTGGHSAHVGVSFAGAAIGCGDCHTGAVEGSTEPTANHRDGNVNAAGYPIQAKGSAYTTCTTASCHQTGQAADNYVTTSNWDVDDANCTQCHAATPATGSHDAHVNTAGYDCSDCHTNAIKDTSYTDANHGDLNIDVAVGGYTADKAIASALESCSINCHSDGINAVGTSPVWGTVGGACDVCHLSDMTTGSHTAHLADGAVCGDCHDGAIKDSDAGTAHTDGDVDVIATYTTLNAAYGTGTWTTCSAASCHDDGRTPNVTAAWGTTVNDCAECHATQPATGSHTTHLALFSCADCHTGVTEGTTAGAGHRDGDIDVDAAATGLATNKTLGSAFTSCGTNNCHGSGSPTWGTDLSANDECTQCHGELVAGAATDAQKAPGGTGVDTNGDSANTDAEVGAHQAHLAAVNGISSAIACSSCHTVPTAITDAGHIDSTLPAEMIWGGLATANSTTPTSCATTYCHDSSAIGNGWGGDEGIALDWATPMMAGDVTDCDNCHGYPPAGGHLPNDDCSACHDNVTGVDDDSFTDASLHINGTVEVSGGDTCTDCHNAALNGVHASHTDVATFLGTKSVGAGDYGTNGWYTTTWTNGTPMFGCGECHPAGEGTSHPTAGLNLDLAPGAAPATSPKSKNDVSGPYNPIFSSGSSVTCSNIYCHSDAQAAGSRTYATTPDWYGGALPTDGTECASCHGNSPTTGTHDVHAVGIHYETLYDGGSAVMASAGASGAAHGDETSSDPISCQTCHNDTVTVAYNSANAVCTTCHSGATGTPATGDERMVISTTSTAHVNAQVDVVFDTLSGYKSRAQVRDDISTVTELDNNWTRNNGYKASNSFDQMKAATPVYEADSSCSSVSCHNGIATPTWDTGSVADCTACHTKLP